MQSHLTEQTRRQLGLTQERLKEVLHYAPTTGRFRWRVRQGGMSPRREAGSSSGAGYRTIHIDGVPHLAHRLAWLYVKGEHPTGEIDHKNGMRTDNRIVNLRDSPPPKNRWNVVRRNASGAVGVYRRGAKWRARIVVNGRQIELGIYDSKQEAAAAYICAARLLRGEFLRNARVRKGGPRFVLAPAVNE